MVGILILILFVVAGVLTGLNIEIPYSYSQYIAVAILAFLDSVFGAFSANIEKKFRMNIFLSGFFGNAIIAMLLVYIGSKLDVDIYLAAIIVVSTRFLNNFTAIRREFILKFDKRKKNKTNDESKNKVDETKEINNEEENTNDEVKEND